MLHQREAAAARAGEADRLDARVADQRAAELVVVARQQRERRLPAGRCLATALASRAPTSSPVPGCAGWPFTTTGQPAASAEAVSPPATEKASGKLLTRRTPPPGRAAMLQQPQIGPRQRLAVGQRGVDRGVEPVALAHDLRRTAAAGRPSGRARLRGARAAGRFRPSRARSIRRRSRGYPRRRPRERRAARRIGRGVGGECGFGERGGRRDRVGAGTGEARLKGLTGGRVDRAEPRVPLEGLGTDQNGAVNHTKSFRK